MSREQPPNRGDANSYFLGLVPGPGTIESDWNVDVPNVIKRKDPMSLLSWMADAQRPQPIMAAYVDHADDDDATPRQREIFYPHPNLALPRPALTYDFRMSVTLKPAVSVGKTPFGERRWISFSGGSWSASFGTGTVVPGGQDSQIIVADLSTRVETNYLLQTNDDPPAFIVAKTHGWRTGPPDVLADLLDPTKADKVEPTSYMFRLFIDLETGDERYREKVNCGMWVGSGMRKGAEVVYDAYRVS